MFLRCPHQEGLAKWAATATNGSSRRVLSGVILDIYKDAERGCFCLKPTGLFGKIHKQSTWVVGRRAMVIRMGC